MRSADLIRLIADDNRAGAAELLARAAEAMAALASETARLSDTRDATRAACEALAAAQPRMAPLARIAEAAWRAAQDSTPAESARAAARAAEDFLAWAAEAACATARHAVSLIFEGAALLTHSRSSTVLEAFLEARRAGRAFRVIATESRPLCEGRALAEQLASAGIATTLIADAAAALALPSCDFVLIGADALTEDEVVNKIGTRMIALAARQSERPIYAACDTSKFISRLPSEEAPRDPAQLWPDPPPGVTIFNRYFESTPRDWFSGIITENGVV